MSWIQEHEDGVVLSIRVVPRASRTEIVGLHDGALKVKLQSPPVDGKANKQLLKFLGRKLGASGAAVSITSGETSQRKKIFVKRVSAEAARAILLPGEDGAS